MSLDLGELLSLLVSHHTRLNELFANGQFRSKKYQRHQNCIRQIHNAIKAITDLPTLSSPTLDSKQTYTPDKTYPPA
jgi:hypothetical protein